MVFFSLGSSESGKTLYLGLVEAGFCCLERATFKGKHWLGGEGRKEMYWERIQINMKKYNPARISVQFVPRCKDGVFWLVPIFLTVLGKALRKCAEGSWLR